jgi:GNAT superfamily N-acetyltransferase
MTIRRATAEDRDRLLPLIEEFYRVDNQQFELSRIDAGLMPLLSDDRYGQVWLTCDLDGALTGYAILTWSWSLESGGLDCILDEFFVVRRGGGLGSALLDRAMREARRVGAAAMFLETEAPNDGARRFYARHGFSVDDSLWMRAGLA